MPVGEAMTHRVVCLGDVMVDVLAQLPSQLATGSDTPAPISLLSGGSAANTAAWLVAAGVPTAFVGRVGNDALGRMVLDELAQLGLDLEVSVDPERPTGACIVLVDGGGERTMVPSAGANAGLGEAGFRSALLGPGDHLHVSAYAVFQDGARAAADAAVAAAGEVGASVSVDAASAAPLETFGAERFLSWLPSGLVLANGDEAAVLTGTDDPERAARLLAERCGEAIVKCGARGAVWSDGRAVRSCAAETDVVIDSTGAGDAFAAGVLAARLQGQDVGWCLMAGNRLAARAIATVGARPPRQPLT
jgi:sugar/nucleoside kinase (ribokinase family)